MTKPYSFQDLDIFLRVADSGNMSDVARQLNITNAAVSASIKRLERALHSSLLERTTRSIRLSSAGEQFLPYVQQALGMLEDAESSLKNLHTLVAGDIQLGVPSDLGRNFLLPRLDEFQLQHPHIRVTVHISDLMQDLYRDGLDVVVRYGVLRDSTLIAKKLCDNQRWLVASPAYLAQTPPVKTLEDLRAHNCICFYRNDRPYNQWEFEQGAEKFVIPVRGDRYANDGDLVRRWAIAGRGIAYKSALDVEEDVRRGRLVKLLDGQYESPPSPLYAVYKERRYQPYRLTALLDFLQIALRGGV